MARAMTASEWQESAVFIVEALSAIPDDASYCLLRVDGEYRIQRTRDEEGKP